MRALLLSMTATIALLSSGIAVAVDECPLDLSLKTAPDAFVAALGAMPSLPPERAPERKPIFGQCSYQTSTFVQFAEPPGSFCSIEGQSAIGSVVDILDSESVVVSQTYMVIKSDEALAALRSAFGKIATPVTPQADPDAWKPGHYNAIDAVYAHDDDMWIVLHQLRDAGRVTTAPDYYQVIHVRRNWLDFSRRNLNTCTALPAALR